MKNFAHSRIFKDHNPNSRTFQGLEFSFASSRTFQDFQGPWQPCHTFAVFSRTRPRLQVVVHRNWSVDRKWSISRISNDFPLFFILGKGACLCIEELVKRETDALGLDDGTIARNSKLADSLLWIISYLRSDLSRGVSLPQSGCVRFFVNRIEIYCNTKRDSNFICSCIPPANRPAGTINLVRNIQRCQQLGWKEHKEV